jgi:hypothetical protein
MLRKQSENLNVVDSLLKITNNTNYRKEVAERSPEMKQEKKTEKDRSWATSKGCSRTEYNNPIARNSSSIRSARCSTEGITDIGGPNKHVNVTGKNSIWNSEVLSEIAKLSSSKEMTQQEKISSSELRQQKQSEYKQSISPRYGDEVIKEKANSVSLATANSGGKGWVQSNKISMFDENTNFDRLTALTARINPTVEKEKKIAEMKVVSKSLSSKDISSKFIDNILNQEDSSSYKSLHKDASERLFKILAEKNKE